MIGRFQGALIQGRALDVNDLVSDRARVAYSQSGPIDVVIPVYRGLEETRTCIESVLASRNQCRLRLRIHNDASPEPELGAYLRTVAQTHTEVLLVENDTNLGFVRTVNDAMRRALKNDDFQAVVLLNSDAEVGNDWLDRLAAHADVSERRIASVTALSNNATICSFPRLGANDMPLGFNTAQVDALAAEVNAGMSVSVPTGVGFCMLITKAALIDIGLFDEEAFGRGYGEENDFCMRALKRGYKNLLALDVFVRHVGEVSFADISKPGKVNADRIIRERYPEYHSQVAGFCTDDPALVARLRLTFALWREAGRPVQALITHTLGGGTERHVQETMTVQHQEGPVVILRPVEGHPSRIRIEHPSEFDGFDIEVSCVDGIGFAKLLLAMGVGAVQIHHILGHSDFVRDGLALADINYDFVVHDYYAICPQITLTAPDSRYCGEPGLNACDACIRTRPSHGATDIRNWRAANEWLVLGAANIRTPSRDAADRVERYYGVRPEVHYHEPDVCAERAEHPPMRKAGPRDPYRVVLIGVLAKHKGRQAVIEAAAMAKSHALPLTFHLIGDPQGEVPFSAREHLGWTGSYSEMDLPGLIDDAQADAFLFAAPSPETYSYTLSAAMKTGLPIMATNIGAFPERLAHYGPSRLVPWNINGKELALALVDFFASLQSAKK
jgi:GT2 family glycosyltransferase